MKAIMKVLFISLTVTGMSLSCERPIQGMYWPTTEWKTATAKQCRMDEAVLNKIDSCVKNDLPYISSVLVLRNGYIVFEHYFAGGMATERSLWNQTTTILSAVVGIAVEQGYVKNIDQKLEDFFPIKAAKSKDTRLGKITLRHLLTMTDGISAAGNMLEFYFTDEPKCQLLVTDPGSEFNYNIVSPEITSMIITRATGRMAADLAAESLFRPLGIERITWPESIPLHAWGAKASSGYSRGMGGLVLTTRDMAKIGHLFLNQGLWNGIKILSTQWARESTKAQVETRLSVDYWKSYGYHWWNCNFGEYEVYYSYGKSGQSICVVPELSLVTVVTSTDPEAQKVGGKYIDEKLLKYLKFVDEYLIAAARKQ